MRLFRQLQNTYSKGAAIMSANSKDKFAMVILIAINLSVAYFFESHFGYVMALITAFALIYNITGGEHRHG